MKRALTFLAIASLFVACEKSDTLVKDNAATLSADQNGKTTEQVVGSWRMVEYFNDRGDGVGEWLSANETEIITFSADGKFSSTQTFPNHSSGFDSYRVVGPTTVILTSSSNNYSDEFQYSLQGDEMIFYPKCRENCMRRYVLQ